VPAANFEGDSTADYSQVSGRQEVTVEIRWDEKAGLRRDAVRSQVINVLEAQAIKETGNEEG
jgi:ribosomal protein S24E